MDAYLATLSAYSALVPPTTTARWYGGQAAVQWPAAFVEEASESGRVQYGLGLWNRCDLFALPPLCHEEELRTQVRVPVLVSA